MKPFRFTCPKGHRFTVYADGMSRDERESIVVRGCPYCPSQRFFEETVGGKK